MALTLAAQLGDAFPPKLPLFSGPTVTLFFLGGHASALVPMVADGGALHAFE